MMYHLDIYAFNSELLEEEKGCIPCCGGFPSTHVHRSAGY